MRKNQTSYDRMVVFNCYYRDRCENELCRPRYTRVFIYSRVYPRSGYIFSPITDLFFWGGDIFTHGVLFVILSFEILILSGNLLSLKCYLVSIRICEIQLFFSWILMTFFKTPGEKATFQSLGLESYFLIRCWKRQLVSKDLGRCKVWCNVSHMSTSSPGPWYRWKFGDAFE